MNPRKTILNGKEYELVTAEVVDVDFSGKDKEKLYTIRCKLLGSFGSQGSYNVIQARALDANLKNIPISGEVVLLLKGPTAYNSYAGTGQEYYYTNPISVQSSVHHNGLPGVSEVLTNKKSNSQERRQTSQDGIPAKSSNRLKPTSTIDPAFPERLDVRPIQPYSGDILLEGRWGQSIRFSSTVEEEKREYPVKPYWKKGLGDTGNPITIISNGTNPKNKKDNEFIQENPDEDDSSIWLTSGQEVKFTPASTYTPSIKDKSVDLYKTNKFAGNQVIISSDRLIFNSKKQEFIVFAKEGIGFSSGKAISIDGKQVVEMESERINLGLNAKSPVLLGDRTMDWLNELCGILSNFLSYTTQITVPTSWGPSGPPINTPSFIDLKAKTKALQQKIEKLQSQLAFVNEFSKGPTDEAKANESEREQRQEQRDSGQEPPREKSEPNETALSPRATTTANEWQGYALWDPNRPVIYGVRDKDAVTWFYDKTWKNYISSMRSGLKDTIKGTNTVDGFNVPSDYSQGSTAFDSNFMDLVMLKNTDEIQEQIQPFEFTEPWDFEPDPGQT